MRPQVIYSLVLSFLPANAKRTTCYFHGSCNPTVALFLGLIAITLSKIRKIYLVEFQQKTAVERHRILCIAFLLVMFKIISWAAETAQQVRFVSQG